mmetsp:Transcript_60534/g.126682  ORF Transcript_60534/g.126682 Transcript_60534/m.126682 type:complete len:253 (+) Transcript_60534:452-1210(+)
MSSFLLDLFESLQPLLLGLDARCGCRQEVCSSLRHRVRSVCTHAVEAGEVRPEFRLAPHRFQRRKAPIGLLDLFDENIKSCLSLHEILRSMEHSPSHDILVSVQGLLDCVQVAMKTLMRVRDRILCCKIGNRPHQRGQTACRVVREVGVGSAQLRHNAVNQELSLGWACTVLCGESGQLQLERVQGGRIREIGGVLWWEVSNETIVTKPLKYLLTAEELFAFRLQRCEFVQKVAGHPLGLGLKLFHITPVLL